MSMIVLALQLASSAAPRLAACVISSDGPVTIGSGPGLRRGFPRQPILAGEVFHVPAGVKATMLCSTDWLVIVTGPKEWTVDQKACRQGQALPGGSYDSVVVEGGRIRSIRSGMTVERDTRSDAATDVPMVLSPRNTTVLDPRPTVVWTEVRGADQYEIEWLGTAGATALKIKAADARCGPGRGFWRGLSVCSTAYPADRAALKTGAAPLFLRVGSRFGIASPLRVEKDAARVRVVGAEDEQKFRERLDALQAVPDADSRALLIAGAYASAGFLGDALSRYDEALARQEVPEAGVTLGDLALAVGLPDLAAREYRRVLDRKPAPAAATAAAAEFGLGRAAFALSSFAEARGHFERARELFASLDLLAEACDAKAGAERAALRVPR
jgi:hypothetical protein